MSTQIPNDFDLASIAHRTYTDTPTWTVDVDVAGLLVPIGDIKVVAFRGTRKPMIDLFGSLYDIRRDLDISITKDPQLGGCHTGFLTGTRGIAPVVLKEIGSTPWICVGHSLGGALAIGVAALAILNGQSPQSLVTYGCPRMGFDQLRSIFDGKDVRQYRNGNDPIPDVPSPLPPWFPYVHIRPWIQFGLADRLNPVHCHDMVSGYIPALAQFLKLK